MILQGDLAFFVELPDIDSRSCFESCLFFVCHRTSIFSDSPARLIPPYAFAQTASKLLVDVRGGHAGMLFYGPKDGEHFTFRHPKCRLLLATI